MKDLENRIDDSERASGALSSTAAKALVETLIEFFLDDFSQDAAGVGDWLAQGDNDPDEFIDQLYELREALAAEKSNA